jgi:hypothetical protein
MGLTGLFGFLLFAAFQKKVAKLNSACGGKNLSEINFWKTILICF